MKDRIITEDGLLGKGVPVNHLNDAFASAIVFNQKEGYTIIEDYTHPAIGRFVRMRLISKKHS